MSYFNFNFWVSFSKLRPSLNKLGYNTETVRVFLKDHFGYKSGEEIMQDTGVKKSFLDARLMYKDEEEGELARRFSLLLPIVKEADSRCYWKKNVNALGESIVPGNYDIKYTVAAFEVKVRMKKVIEELFGIHEHDIWIY